jgi:SnoaL-like domain
MTDLVRINDRLMILETLNRYAWGYDSRDLEMLGGTFADNGVFAIELTGTDGWGPYAGRRQITEWLAGVMAQQTDQRRHCVSNVIFRTLDPASAVVDSYLSLTAVERGAARLVCTGTYRDEMIKTGTQWFIQRKVLRLDNPF